MGIQENPFLRAIQLLESSGVPYVIVGGFAVVMYGCNRFTPDLNVVVDFESSDTVRSLITELERAGFLASASGGAHLLLDPEKRAHAFDGGRKWFFSFRHPDSPSFSLDIFLQLPLSYQELALDLSRISLGAATAAIVSFNTLLSLKAIADRGQDKADIAALTLIRRIEHLQKEGASEESIFQLAGSDAEYEQVEGFLRFMKLPHEERLKWLGEMLEHLGKFCGLG